MIKAIVRASPKKDSQPIGDFCYYKMLLIDIWYDLSDMDVENVVNENLRAMLFCHLKLEDEVPNYRVLIRFQGGYNKK
ncbi:MAG: transposase, partial [Ekhidna sp.]|nr:transposase [Ekhidna sp.]